MTAFIVIACIALIAFVAYTNVKKQKELTSQGRIIPRSGSWYENAEVFTLSGADFGRVVSGIQAADLTGTGASFRRDDEKKVILFVAGTWQSVLYEKTDAEGKTVYRYALQHWKTHNGVTQNTVEMNIVLTAVEKVFLTIDPGTKVTAEPIDIKTRTSFF